MTRHRDVYKRVKVLTEKGRDRANVEIPYDATFVGVADIRARTIAPDGTITPLAGKTFNTTLIKSHGVKYQAKDFYAAECPGGKHHRMEIHRILGRLSDRAALGGAGRALPEAR
jgi:hypothetical protein